MSSLEDRLYAAGRETGSAFDRTALPVVDAPSRWGRTFALAGGAAVVAMLIAVPAMLWGGEPVPFGSPDEPEAPVVGSTSLPATDTVAPVAATEGDSAPPDEPQTYTGSAEMMAAAVHHLVTHDHTFGEGPPPFSEYLVEDRTLGDSRASTEEGPDDAAESRPLTEPERNAVEQAIAVYGPVRWISDPDEWRAGSLNPPSTSLPQSPDDPEHTIERWVIIGVGVPEPDGDVMLVAVSLWCGGNCGTLRTYRLEVGDDGRWLVTGTVGPVSLS